MICGQTGYCDACFTGYLEPDKLVRWADGAIVACCLENIPDALRLFTGNYPIEPPEIDIRGEMG